MYSRPVRLSRLRLSGALTAQGHESHKLFLRNTLPPPNAVVWFEQCLDSEEWARQMTIARPFASMEQMNEMGNRIANVLGVPCDAGALRAKLLL